MKIIKTILEAQHKCEKTIFSIFILTLIFSSNVFGQLKYEGTVDAKFKTFQLEDGKLIYVKYDKENQALKLYNLDNVLWKTVKLPLPKFHLLDEIKNISMHTFNNDNLIEVVYSCVDYDFANEMENPALDITHVQFTLNIINENGDSMLKVKDSSEMEIVDSNGVKKILIYKHINMRFNGKDETIIYSLPATK